MEDYLISMALAILFKTIKNPDRKKTMHVALIKLRDQINLLYPGE